MPVSANAACTIYDMYIAKATDDEIAEATGIPLKEVTKTIEEFITEQISSEEDDQYDRLKDEVWYEDEYEEERNL